MLAKASMKLKNVTAEKADTLTPAQLAVLQVRAVIESVMQLYEVTSIKIVMSVYLFLSIHIYIIYGYRY